MPKKKRLRSRYVKKGVHFAMVNELKQNVSIIDSYRVYPAIKMFWDTLKKLIGGKDINLYVHGFGMFKIRYLESSKNKKISLMQKEMKKFASSLKRL